MLNEIRILDSTKLKIVWKKIITFFKRRTSAYYDLFQN